MNVTAKRFLRWLAVFGCLAFSLYHLASSLRFMFSRPAADGTVLHFFPLLTLVLLYGPPLVAAYFLARRQYRAVGRLLALLGSFFIFALLIILPRQFGYREFERSVLADPTHSNLVFLLFPVSIALFIGPVAVAAWLYRNYKRKVEPRIFSLPPSNPAA